MKNKVLIFIIVLLLIGLGVVSVLYYNEVKNNTIDKSNFIVEMNEKYPDSIGREFLLEYSVGNINAQEEEKTSVFLGAYHYTGFNKGKLIIDEKEIKINSIIKDLCITANYTDMQAAANGAITSYKYISTLYILFEDGTIGKITTEDIKNGKYSVTIMPEYSNIDFFVETDPIEHGGESLLWAVTKDGKTNVVDTLSAGN